jgi:hypothetical protein
MSFNLADITHFRIDRGEGYLSNAAPICAMLRPSTVFEEYGVRGHALLIKSYQQFLGLQKLNKYGSARTK